MILHAQEQGRPLRIAVSALTHQAIDQVLKKVVALIKQHGLQGFPARCFKLGRWDLTERGVEPLEDVETLAESPYAIVGATGFGLYQLLEGLKGTFPQVFDWVVFDEASQMLIPQALLSLLYGKGNFLFAGDTKQLPPIVLGDYKGKEIEHTSFRAVPSCQSIRSLAPRSIGSHVSDERRPVFFSQSHVV